MRAPSTAVTQITAAVLQHAAALSDPGLQVHCQLLPEEDTLVAQEYHYLSAVHLHRCMWRLRTTSGPPRYACRYHTMFGPHVHTCATAADTPAVLRPLIKISRADRWRSRWVRALRPCKACCQAIYHLGSAAASASSRPLLLRHTLRHSRCERRMKCLIKHSRSCSVDCACVGAQPLFEGLPVAVLAPSTHVHTFSC